MMTALPNTSYDRLEVVINVPAVGGLELTIHIIEASAPTTVPIRLVIPAKQYLLIDQYWYYQL